MAWANFDLSGINPNADTIAAGEYTFQLGGAKFSDRDPGRLEVNATIVSAGDFSGRKMFFSYPDPGSISARTGKVNDWSGKALKRLEQAIGVDAAPGEAMDSYLNRVAGHRFDAPVTHRSYESEAGPQTRAEVNIFATRPASQL